MPEYRTPLKKRMQASDRFQRHYRTNPEFRLHCLNLKRAERGEDPLPPGTELPPVGKLRSHVASKRKRDDKGRWLGGPTHD